MSRAGHTYTHTQTHRPPHLWASAGRQKCASSAPAEAQGRGPASPGETCRPSWEPWRGHGAGAWVMRGKVEQGGDNTEGLWHRHNHTRGRGGPACLWSPCQEVLLGFPSPGNGRPGCSDFSCRAQQSGPHQKVSQTTLPGSCLSGRACLPLTPRSTRGKSCPAQIQARPARHQAEVRGVSLRACPPAPASARPGPPYHGSNAIGRRGADGVVVGVSSRVDSAVTGEMSTGRGVGGRQGR